MLHFCQIAQNVVYTSVCDRSEFEYLQEMTAFLYGFSKEKDAIITRKAHSWVTPKLFYIQDELRTMNFFWCMAKQQ